MKLTVNLVPPRPLDKAVLRKIRMVLLVFVGFWLMVSLVSVTVVWHRHQKVLDGLAEMTAKESAVYEDGADHKGLQDEARKAEQIMQRRDFRWSRMLNHLEQTWIEGIQVRSIKPDFGKQTLSILVLAKDETVFREYLAGLLRYKPYSQVLLLRQENSTVKDALGQTYSALRCELRIQGGF